MNIGFGFVIEGLVAILLLFTIGYCVMLNKRLKRLKADEQTLKATISELITATEIAERAIAGLKVTVQECDAGLGQRLRAGEMLSVEIGRQVAAGEQVLAKLAQVVTAGRTLPPLPLAASVQDAQSTVAAAHAFAARSRLRGQNAAA